MTIDMDEIEAKVARQYRVFDAKRKKLIARYETSQTHKAQLLALAKIVRQHAEYMDGNLLSSGWQTKSIFSFADQIERIGKEL